MRLAVALLALAGGFAYVGGARADAPTLMLSFGGEPRSFTSAELLGRPDAATLAIPADVAYGRPMTFRAVPLLALIGNSADTSLDTIEARASDGFVSQLPRALVEKGASGGSVAWIAVEDAAAPWPNLPDKQVSAGPFYLVWEHSERSGVGSEQWPYQIAALTAGGRAGAARTGGVRSAVHAVPSHEGRGRR